MLRAALYAPPLANVFPGPNCFSPHCPCTYTRRSRSSSSLCCMTPFCTNPLTHTAPSERHHHPRRSRSTGATCCARSCITAT